MLSPFPDGAPADGVSKSVLVAEDDGRVCHVLCLMLERLGYRVSHASDGVEACDLLARGSFDVLMTDLVMPKMDGFALAQHVRIHYPAVKLIFFTGYGESVRGLLESRDMGAEILLHKPIPMNELKTALNQCLGEKSERELPQAKGMGSQSAAQEKRSRVPE